MKDLSILMISRDRDLFIKDSEVRRRILTFSSLVKELHIIIFSKKVNFKNIKIDNIYIYSTNSFSKWFYIFDAFFLGKKILSLHKNDLITAQDPFECGFVAYMLAKIYNLAFNVQEHGDFYSGNYWKNETIINYFRYYFGIFILKRADSIRVVSERIFRTLTNRFGINKERIVKVPVYINVNNKIIDNKDNKFKNNFVFLTMGRLVKQKNLVLLIRVFKKIVKNNPNAFLIVVGKGSEKSKIVNLVNKEKLFNNVSFINWTKNIDYYYNNADAYVLPSNYEGWGRVIVEAANHSLPIIMTDVGCANELIVHKKSGLIVPIGDKKSLEEAMEKILQNNDLRNKLSFNAKKVLEILPSREETLDLYKKSWQLAFENKNKNIS